MRKRITLYFLLVLSIMISNVNLQAVSLKNQENNCVKEQALTERISPVQTQNAVTTPGMIQIPNVPSQITPPEEELQPAYKLYIPIIVKGLQAKFWDPVRAGSERAAADFGVNISFEGPIEEENAEEQLRILAEALIKHPEAIILSATDSKAATPYLEQAQARGIPVIGVDSGVDSPIVKTTVGTDNYGAGALAAEKMAQLLGGKGEVGVIVQDRTSKVATDRRDGFVDTIRQKFPEMQVVEVAYGKGNTALSEEVAKQMIADHPNIKGIFGGNEGSAYGVVNAVKDLNKVGDITIVGFDSGKKLIDAINEGTVAGAVTQDPEGMGYKAVETAIRAYRGDTLPEFIDTGFAWYDKSNINNPEIRRLLYE